jgi:hypothetical protein
MDGSLCVSNNETPLSAEQPITSEFYPPVEKTSLSQTPTQEILEGAFIYKQLEQAYLDIVSMVQLNFYPINYTLEQTIKIIKNLKHNLDIYLPRCEDPEYKEFLKLKYKNICAFARFLKESAKQAVVEN